jgi:hypothetical protein
MTATTGTTAMIIKDPRRIFFLVVITCVFTVLGQYPSVVRSTTPGGFSDLSERLGALADAVAASSTGPSPLSLRHPGGANAAGTATATPVDICFVSSIFGESEGDMDRPGDFSNFTLGPTSSFSLLRRWGKKPTFKFFLFTNLDGLAAPGWTKIVKDYDDLPYRRYITRSRWGKFLGWKEPTLKPCGVIFYFDGHFEPDPTVRDRFADMADRIRRSPYGLAQVKHRKSKTALQEFDSILKSTKDIPRNIEASIRWFASQPDFKNNCTLYENSYFGYDPNNARFQEASEFFWDRYSLELDSWRDQPLWCYTLEHFHLRPILHDPIFRKNVRRTGHNDHHYDETSDSDAVRNSTTTMTTSADHRVTQ